jgi:hypothetical protein
MHYLCATKRKQGAVAVSVDSIHQYLRANKRKAGLVGVVTVIRSETRLVVL